MFEDASERASLRVAMAYAGLMPMRVCDCAGDSCPHLAVWTAPTFDDSVERAGWYELAPLYSSWQ